jgi:hypothetical protein
MGKIQEPFFSGLQYARNYTLHGAAIVAAVSVEGPRERKVLKGEIRVGGGNATVSTWGFLDDPEPYDPASGKRERNKERRRDYNAHVAGYSVQSRIPRALHDLGVYIWDPSPPLAPRPAPRLNARVDPQAVVSGPLLCVDGVVNRQSSAMCST